MDGSSDTDALAGQTFYRTIASPSETGQFSYIEIINPAGSGVNLFLDALELWGGDGVPSEYGIMHYATPFNDPGLVGHVYNVSQYPFVQTNYGGPAAKSEIFVGTSSEQLAERIDYYWHAPSAAEVSNLVTFPYPLIIGPGDGLVFWNTIQGVEGEAGMWVREKPVA